MEDQKQDAPTAPNHDRERGSAALVILDMINDFAFEGGAALAGKAKMAAERIVKFRQTVEAAGLPVIYVNDNFGEWHSERSRLVAHALAECPAVAKLIAPLEEDYFIIKPKFSGFYATNLAVLLPKLGVSRLILTGVATDICILFTAADAHMRDYGLWVPRDLVATEDESRGDASLAIMAASMGAEIAPASELSLGQWTRRLNDRPRS